MNSGYENSFKKAQLSFLVINMIAYMLLYLTRKNLSIALPDMLSENVVTKNEIGWIITFHGLLYGVGRFVNGLFADKTDGKTLLITGLILSALMNLLFGLSNSVALFAIFWIINGYTQAIGGPSCIKMLAHWFHPKELATRMSIWTTSISIGTMITLGLCTLLFYFGCNWRWSFIVPAIVSCMISLLVCMKLKSDPPNAGFKDMAQTYVKYEQTISNKDLWKRLKAVISNKFIIICALLNFMLYVVRLCVLDWGPTFLKEYNGVPVEKSGLIMISFNFSALLGNIFTGLITDKWFKGHCLRANTIYMIMVSLNILLLCVLPSSMPVWVYAAILFVTGFFIYGSLTLIGTAAIQYATTEATALANGFIGISGYAASTAAGIGIALVSTSIGWKSVFIILLCFAALGSLMSLCSWRYPASGYDKDVM